jgi:hypothetical protein
MTGRFYVWRWSGSRWRPDSIDPDGVMLGELSWEAACARVAYLLATYQKRRRRPLWPPPVITLGEVPQMKPRQREKSHTFTAAELDGQTYRELPEEVHR